ncbi:tripartite tricarboxylate transporter TctB family protein [Devosia naphthalenivorans]|uniref:tripartite tricarboxylate transporter TctB family protein n=1 Tax=Devosia naphthalenivorans TaxID=2082392 RepID=UPI000D33860F|nr:tripartite tricarboxylate transporter TctB family protein [Devosia naphthalenivorans]
MTDKQRNLFTAALLFVVASVWTVITVQTIPGGFSPGDIGARGFPLILGIALGILSLGLAIKTWMACPLPLGVEDETEDFGAGRSTLSVLIVLGHLVAYGFLMDKIGFALSTFVITLSMMVIGLRERNPLKILAFSVGTAFGAWLVFSRLLGVYMPLGTMITFG